MRAVRTLLLAVALGGALAPALGDEPSARRIYLLCLKDGSTVRLTAPPVRKGSVYEGRLDPDGKLVSYPARDVDAERTEETTRLGGLPEPTPTPFVRKRGPEPTPPLGDRARLNRPRAEAEKTLSSASGTARDSEPAEEPAARRKKVDRAPKIPDPVDAQGRGEAYWRERAGRLRRSLDRAEAELRLAEEAAGRYEREAPINRGLGVRETYAYELLRLRNAVDRARGRVTALRQQVEELSEEARRAGAFPGWLR